MGENIDGSMPVLGRTAGDIPSGLSIPKDMHPTNMCYEKTKQCTAFVGLQQQLLLQQRPDITQHLHCCWPS